MVVDFRVVGRQPQRLAQAGDLLIRSSLVAEHLAQEEMRLGPPRSEPKKLAVCLHRVVKSSEMVQRAAQIQVSREGIGLNSDRVAEGSERFV